MTNERSGRLKGYLEQAFQPEQLLIVDDSKAHAGHQHQGGGHFSVVICSDLFQGRSTVERHRMVYSAVSELIPDEIHALSIKAVTPQEAKAAA